MQKSSINPYLTSPFLIFISANASKLAMLHLQDLKITNDRTTLQIDMKQWKCADKHLNGKQKLTWELGTRYENTIMN